MFEVVIVGDDDDRQDRASPAVRRAPRLPPVEWDIPPYSQSLSADAPAPPPFDEGSAALVRSGADIEGRIAMGKKIVDVRVGS